MKLSNFKSKSTLLPVLAVAAGLLGLLLRLWLYGTGLDDQNLLLHTHPAGYLIPVLSLLVVIAAFFLVRPLHTCKPYEELFPRSAVGAIGSWIGSVGLIMAAMVDLVQRETVLTSVTGILGVAGAGCLAYVGQQRLTGNRPGFSFHAAVCLYFAMRLISRYQNWSADPQLQDYCFQLLAIVCLMLYSYHRSALDFKDGSGRAMTAFGLLSIYFCCLALVRSDNLWLYLTMAVWVFTSLLRQPLNTPEEDPA